MSVSYFDYALSFIMQGTAQRFALPALGQGRRSRPARKMIRRRKLPEIAAESPASGARFVGQWWIGRLANIKKGDIILPVTIIAYINLLV